MLNRQLCGDTRSFPQVRHSSQNSLYFRTAERALGIAFTFVEILVYNITIKTVTSEFHRTPKAISICVT